MDVGTIIQLLSAAGIGGLLGSTLTWRLRRGHERRELWAQYALEITKLHLEAQEKEAEATGKTITVLAPTKLFREVFRAFEEFDRTGEWSGRAMAEGILNVSHITPKVSKAQTQDGAEVTLRAEVPPKGEEPAPDISAVIDVLLHEDREYRQEFGNH